MTLSLQELAARTAKQSVAVPPRLCPELQSGFPASWVPSPRLRRRLGRAAFNSRPVLSIHALTQVLQDPLRNRVQSFHLSDPSACAIPKSHSEQTRCRQSQPVACHVLTRPVSLT